MGRAFNLLIVAAAVMVAAVGCSIFEPDAPETPSEQGFVWQQPYQYITVLSNLDNAMENLSAEYYMLCYDTSFVFVADEQDTAQYTWEFGNWDYIQEQNAINLIMGEAIADSSVVSVAFTEPSNPDLQDPSAYEDSIWIYRDYIMSFENSPHTPAQGRAYIHLGKPSGTSGLWSICEWRDNRLPDHDPDEDNTWGVFKGFYLFSSP